MERRYTLCLVVTLIAAVLSKAVRADRDIVVSIQRYAWSGKYYQDPFGGGRSQMLRDLGDYHIYRMYPDGSARWQITFGQHDDTEPRWSPDGRSILFERDADNQPNALCIVRASGGAVRRLTRNLPSIDCNDYSWCPDGKTIGVRVIPHEGDLSWLYLINIRTRGIHKIPDVTDFAWSPDGGRIYLCHSKGAAEIRQISSGRSVRVSSAIVRPFWVSPHMLAGEPPVINPNTPDRLDTVKFIGNDGKLKRTLKIDFRDPTGEGAAYSTLTELRRWFPAPNSRMEAVVEYGYIQSDGAHYGCFRVDLRSGSCKFIADGQLVGISDVGPDILVADDDWIGNYKEFRGGRRAGPIESITFRGTKKHKISEELLSVDGGDWRKSSMSIRNKTP